MPQKIILALILCLFAILGTHSGTLAAIQIGMDTQLNNHDNTNVTDRLAARLGISLNYRFTQPSPAGMFNESDVDLLAKLIMLEARGEPFEGQVAVAAVVLNRIHSTDFPDSVPDVIYQRGQFHTARKLTGTAPNQSALNAAKAALRGSDPSHGALYFYNPATCSEKARRYLKNAGFQVSARIGNHVFLK